MTDPDDLQPPANAAGWSDPSLPDPGRTDRAPAVAGSSSPIPFEDLEAPLPVGAAPPLAARALAFVGVLVGGLLGGLIGYGTADLMADGVLWSVLGLLVGALAGATGVGIVSGLTLRAMSEWQATAHPEAEAGRGSRRRPGRGPTDSQGYELRPHLGRRPTGRADGGSDGS
jgi:hypothetical protein